MSLVSTKHLQIVLQSIKSILSRKADKSDIIQSDWEQNNKESNDYIKNRPFYDENGEIHSLDEKYISYVAGRKTNNGAEIFNNYANNVADGQYAHAEGSLTEAHGEGSHAEGWGTKAIDRFSHAEGFYSLAYGQGSHAEGATQTGCDYQHTQGKNNIVDIGSTYAHIVGNGKTDTNRSNAHTLDWNGNAWYQGDVYVGSTSGINKDEGSKKLATEEFVLENSSSVTVDSIVDALGYTPETGGAAFTAENNAKAYAAELVGGEETRATEIERSIREDLNTTDTALKALIEAEAAERAATDETLSEGVTKNTNDISSLNSKLATNTSTLTTLGNTVAEHTESIQANVNELANIRNTGLILTEEDRTFLNFIKQFFTSDPNQFVIGNAVLTCVELDDGTKKLEVTFS